MPLSRRHYRLIVGPPGGEGVSWASDEIETALNIAFDLRRTPKRGANKGKIEIFNPGKKTLGIIQADKPVAILDAGYEGGQSGQIFAGDVIKVGLEWRGPDRVAVLEVGEKELALRETRFDRSYPPETTSAEVLADVAAALGVGEGNLADLDEVTYNAGWSHTGLARAALDELTDDVGRKSWMLQDGQLYVLGADDKIEETGPVLAPDSGLIGTPKPLKKGLELEALLRPELSPGRAIRVFSPLATVNGWFVIREVRYVGEYRGNAWHAKIKARERK